MIGIHYVNGQLSLTASIYQELIKKTKKTVQVVDSIYCENQVALLAWMIFYINNLWSDCMKKYILSISLVLLTSSAFATSEACMYVIRDVESNAKLVGGYETTLARVKASRHGQEDSSYVTQAQGWLDRAKQDLEKSKSKISQFCQ